MNTIRRYFLLSYFCLEYWRSFSQYNNFEEYEKKNKEVVETKPITIGMIVGGILFFPVAILVWIWFSACKLFQKIWYYEVF